MSAGGIRMDNVEKINNSVPLGQKIAFGFGMLANQLFPALLSIFIVVLIQDLGFNPLRNGCGLRARRRRRRWWWSLLVKIEGDPLNTQHAQHQSVQATDR